MHDSLEIVANRALDGLPRLAQTMVDAGKLELTESELHEIVVNDKRERLY